ncbi:treslin isoform X2 [Lepidochelys kempii]|uniref:treslin isoform X2 n=1 Tax=Lepidochelys kempii TaxID=8472 RepID=UPI003C6EF267
MTCSHNVVFLLDVASSLQKNQLQLGCLRILNYLGCRFGLAKVRWGFKFFDSLGARGRAARVGDFCELGPRSWEDFEEELESRFGVQSHKSHLPGPVPRATLTQNVLKETLLDYQWDRPEITSPAKPFLRSQKSRLIVAPDEPLESHMPSEGFVNAVFLFSPCPHSQRELLQFVSGSDVHSCCDLPSSQEVAEKLLPKRVQEMIAGQKITLYWVDTAEWSKVLESPDHAGYWTIFELICLVGGIVLPSETLIQGLSHHRTEAAPLFCRKSSSSRPQFVPWTTILPFTSTLNCLLSKPSVFQASFPQQEGALFLSKHGVEKQWRCAVILEPIAMNQRHFQSPVSIFLKGTLTDWNLVKADNFLTESWILQSSQAGQSEQDMLFQQLVRRLITEKLHMIAEVSASEVWSPCTAVLSPLSDTVAVLTLFCTEKAAEVQRCLLQGAVTESSSKDYAFHLPEVVSSVLSQVDISIRDDLDSSEPSVPEWVQQELSRTGGWNPAIVEGWYSLSNICGASSDLMESFKLLQAVSATEKEEASQPEMELTHCLSEFYQRKSSEASATAEPRDHKKRRMSRRGLRGVPRTPVRQKMKTMSRSLQMLNVARLNVKAQKFQPDGVPPAAGEKVPQKLLRRSDDKLEENRRVLKISIDFKTEEEMLSHLTANYQEAVVNGEFLTFVCARNMVTAIKSFLKPKDAKEREVACLDRVRSHLLKSSKTLRQQYDVNPNKETKVRECQLQVFLRLEMCLQCPSLQSRTDEMEQLVEEMTEMLRILCLTEDPGYLTKFLEEVLVAYMDSIPKTLGGLYYSLGTQIPPKLASVLPADFFSDDSMTLDSRSPTLPPSVTSVPAHSTASLSTETDQLEELRTRSAKKRRRNNALARHRSMTEASQNLRQIEIPQLPKNPIRKENSLSYFATEKAHQLLPLQKEAVQEVTKVRRNLFNEEMLSPSKRSLKKMPRSQSVSAVEGLRHKRRCSDEDGRDHRKLLTKRVSETPLHKQISRRLLHKQIKGRCSNPGSDISIVEESPEKAMSEVGLRRSPRIKQLSLNRTHSGSFYSTAQPSSRNMQRVHLVQREVTCVKQDITGIPQYPDNPTIPSPKRLLFGAVLEANSPKLKDSLGTRRTRHSSDLEEPIAYQTPQKPLSSASRMPRKSPRTPHRTPKTLKTTPGKSPAAKQTAAKCLGRYFSPSRQEKSPPYRNERKKAYLAQVTPRKDSSPVRLSSPYKEVGLLTPEKQAGNEVLDDMFSAPLKDSSPATASYTAAQLLCTTNEKSITDPQTQRRSLRSFQKTASPASIQMQTLHVEIQRNPQLNFHLESVSQPMEATSRKVRCAAPKSSSPVGGVAAALSPEAQATLKTRSSLNSPFESSIKTLSTDSPPHSKTRYLDWEFNTPKKSPLKSQNIAGTSPRKALGSPICAPGHTKCGEENPALSLSKSARNKQKHHSNGNARLPAQSSLIHEPKASESVHMLERSELVGIDAQGSSPRKDQSLEKQLSPEGHVQISDVVSECEHLDSSSLDSRKSDASEARVLPSEEPKESKTFTVKKPSRSDILNALPATSKSASPAYSLRCTPDRMQREAAARLGNPELPAKFSTPKSHKLASASPPTYEVELEMQASGLPKLRIKRVGSGSAMEVQSQLKTSKPSGEESPFSELAVAWCARHPGKLAAACVSPSCCHSSHSTPGKGGGQTYICQSYTPTSCASNTTSPSHVDAGVPWTPSPKHKGKTTPDAIKDWPRRKKAANSNANGGCGRCEKHAECTGNVSASEEGGTISDQCISSKALRLADFELEGVYRLQDQSPSSDTEPRADEGASTGTFGLKSRKRAFDLLSPEEETKGEAKRSCTTRDYLDLVSSSTDESSTSKRRISTMPPGRTTMSSNRTPGPQSSIGDDDVFSVSGSTPPVKGSLSASGLRALTQSPLLYQGQTPSRKKCAKEDELDVFQSITDQEVSPFSSAGSRRRPLSRTYSRKKLLS